VTGRIGSNDHRLGRNNTPPSNKGSEPAGSSNRDGALRKRGGHPEILILIGNGRRSISRKKIAEKRISKKEIRGGPRREDYIIYSQRQEADGGGKGVASRR